MHVYKHREGGTTRIRSTVFATSCHISCNDLISTRLLAARESPLWPVPTPDPCFSEFSAARCPCPVRATASETVGPLEPPFLAVCALPLLCGLCHQWLPPVMALPRLPGGPAAASPPSQRRQGARLPLGFRATSRPLKVRPGRSRTRE